MDRENNYKLKLIDVSDNTMVPSGGGTVNNDVQPPEGEIYQIINAWLDIPDPAGSAASNHVIYGQVGADNSQRWFSFNSNTGLDITTYYNQAQASSENPSVSGDQQSLFSSQICISHTHFLRLRYLNNTDVNQTGTRTMKLLVKVYREAI